MYFSGAGHKENSESTKLVSGCTCWGRREIWASMKISAMDKLWTLSEEMPCEALTVALGWLPCTRRAGTAVTPPTALIRAIHINLPAHGYCQVCREMLQEKNYGAIGEDISLSLVPCSNSLLSLLDTSLQKQKIEIPRDAPLTIWPGYFEELTTIPRHPGSIA